MKIFIINKNQADNYGLIVGAILFAFMLQSCNPTKYVPENKYLLNKNKLIVNKSKDIDKSEMRSYIKQSTNKEMLGVKFKLGLYNLSNLEKDKGLNKWFRKIGEEPVIFDQSLDRKSVQQLKSYLNRRGYFDAEIYDTVWYRKRKAFVEYQIQTKDPYKLGKISYDIQDPVLQPYIAADSANTILKSGDNYDVRSIDRERDRIEVILRNNGFFDFNKAYISFVADSTAGDHLIDLTVVVKPYGSLNLSGQASSGNFQKYRIRNVNIFMDYNPGEALKNPAAYYSGLDTTYYKGYSFTLKNKKPPLEYEVVLRSNYIIPGSLYRLSDIQQTKSHLGSLDMIKLVDVYFTRKPSVSYSDTGLKELDCNILLAPNKLQSYSIELEGTNSSGNFGASVNLVYQHRNLFRKAEVFNLKLKNSFENVPAEEGKSGKMIDLGLGADIIFPRFLVPFLKKEDFVKKYNPKTSLFMAYSYQRRPEYNRTMFTTSFGYNWQASKFISHILTPLDMNIVKLPYIDSAWAEHIDTTSYLAYSYKDAFIAGANYSFIFTNQTFREKMDYFYLRVNLSTSGNLIHATNRLFNKNSYPDGNTLFGIEYSQYFMWDIDLRYHNIINENSSIVYRGFIGLGVPYGNSKALPFARQYYTGGANDIRAWQVRSLGPGSYVQENTRFFNQTADMKLVANIEARFNLFWIMEGAFFLDAGNIWAISKTDDREGAQFGFNTFLNEMALGTGFGLRFDFSFFIFRIDLGYKLRDPGIKDASKWVPFTAYKDMTLNLAIGYPF